MPPGFSSLMIWIVSPAAMIVGVPLLWWALFGDRQRGRRRCPRCWHDLTGTPGLTCGECGHTARREGALHRTRVRLGAVLVALLLLIGGLGAAMWDAERDGWTELVPDGMLLSAMPWCSSSSDALMRELQLRYLRGDLSGDEVKELVDRCFAGDSDAPPMSRAWMAKYAEPLFTHLRSRHPDDRSLDSRLLGLPPLVTVSGPQTWHAEAPVCLLLSVDHLWWPQWADAKFTVIVLHDGEPIIDEPMVMCLRQDATRSAPLPVVVNALPAGDQILDVQITVDRRSSANDPRWVPAHTQTLQAPMTISESPAATLTRVDSPEHAAAIRRVFDAGLLVAPEGLRRRRIRFEVRETAGESWANVAVGVVVEVCRDGVVARRSRLWWSGGWLSAAAVAPGRPQMAWQPAEERRDLLDLLGMDTAAWTMRIRGDLELARRVNDPSLTQWWAGEIEIPLEVTPQPQAFRGSVWFEPEEDDRLAPAASAPSAH